VPALFSPLFIWLIVSIKKKNLHLKCCLRRSGIDIELTEDNKKVPAHSDKTPAQQQLFQQPLSQQPLFQQALSQQPLSQQPLSQQPLSQQPLSQQPLSQQPFKNKVNCLITLNTAENIKAYTKFQEEYNNVLNESIQVNHHIDRYNKDHRELKEDISQLNAINIISTLLMLTRL